MGTPQNSKNKVVKYKFILREPKQNIIDLILQFLLNNLIIIIPSIAVLVFAIVFIVIKVRKNKKKVKIKI